MLLSLARTYVRVLYAGFGWIEALPVFDLQLKLHILVGQLLDLLLQFKCFPLNDLLLELIGLVSMGNLVEEELENRVDKARRLHKELLGDGKYLIFSDL
jgi:hypothetical protein